MNAVGAKALAGAPAALLSPAEPASRVAFDGPPRLDLAAQVRAACPSVTGLPRLAREVLALARGPGRLSPAEFFLHRLWDPAYALGDKRAFVGKVRQGEFHRACNDPGWLAVAGDKIVAHALLRNAGVAQLPRIKALWAGDRRVDGVRALRFLPALEVFLRDPDAYPFFAKPLSGIYSLGALHGRRYDGSANTVLLADGHACPLDAVVHAVTGRPGGYVFQDVLTPHGHIAALTGGRLCSVRFLVLLTRGVPVIRSAVIKIPTGRNVADNYWRPGNRLGAVDLDAGTITRVVTGTASSCGVIRSIRTRASYSRASACPAGARPVTW